MKFELTTCCLNKEKPHVEYRHSSQCELIRKLIRESPSWQNTAICIVPENDEDLKQLETHLEICYALHLEKRS